MPYKDPQKKLEYQRVHQQAHPEQWREYSRVYRLAHPEARRASQQAYQRMHPEASRAYAQAHPEKVQATQRANREAHREERREYNRVYQQTHPVILQAVKSRRRARKRGLLATLTAEQWEAILLAYKHRCAYCGSKSKKLTQDHVIPLSKGGGTTADNIVPACGSCNSAKGDRPPILIPAIRLLI